MDPFTSAIVRVLDEKGETAGTGFVASADGLIVTCAHVAGNSDSTDIVFHATGERRTARILKNFSSPAHNDDVVIMSIDGELPSGVRPIALGFAAGCQGHPFETFGYPTVVSRTGMGGRGTIGRLVPREGWSDLLQLHSADDITVGFSGAPIVDSTTGRVAGMVTSIVPRDQYGKQAGVAFATPTETLRGLCPALVVSDMCPYRGLESFSESDSSLFFGRARVVAKLIDALRREPRFLAVLGPSGSGKSSLIHAGLIPQLRAGNVPGSERWRLIKLRPALDPFTALKDHGIEGATLSSAVDRWTKNARSESRCVLIIDQFEEAFSVPDGDRLLCELAELLESAPAVSLVIAMRDDFYDSFSRRAPRLLEWVERGLVNSPALEPDELADVVRRPAEALGLRLEPGLADAIVADALEGESAARSTILPLLEFTLTQVWERRVEGVLGHDAYRTAGGVAGSLSQWADRAYYQLDAEHQQIARRVFTDLVHLGADQQPHGRRRRARESLARPGDEPGALERVIQHLIAARLLAGGRDQQTSEETVELIHDAMLREWGLLRKWIRDSRRFLVWRQEIEHRCEKWIELDYDDGSLLRGADLAQAISWTEERKSDIGERESLYIARSVEWKDKEDARWRHLAGKAEREARFSRSREHAAAAINNLATDPELSILLALEAVAATYHSDREVTPEARDALQRAVEKSRVRLRFNGHRAAILRVAWSADGRLIATAGEDKQAGLWDARTGGLLRFIQIHGQAVTGVAFSPDSARIVTSSRDGTARVSYVDGPDDVLVLAGHRGWVNGVAWNADGSHLATAGEDGTVRLFDANSGECLFSIEAHKRPVTAVAFDPKGDAREHHLATASEDESARTWVLHPQIADKKHASWQGFEVRHEDRVMGTTFCPNWTNVRAIATASFDKSARVARSLAGRSGIVLRGHTNWLNDVAFHEATGRIVTASYDRTAKVWDPLSEHELFTLAGHGGWVLGCAFSPDGSQVVTGGADGVALIWDASPIGESLTLRSHVGWIGAVCFSPDGSRIATAGDDAYRMWDAATGDLIYTRPVETREYSAVTFSPDGRRIAVGCSDHVARICDADDGKPLFELVGHMHWIGCVTYSPDGKLIATSSSDCTVRLWRAEDGEPTGTTLTHDDWINGVTFSPDGKLMATASNDKTARLWKTETGELLETLKGHTHFLQGLAFHPNGKELATVSHDSTIRLWDLERGGSRQLRGHSGWVRCLAYNNDGSLLATGSADRTIRIWNVSAGEYLYSLTGHADEVWSLGFSPDGSRIVSASSDQTARVWDAKTGVELLTLCLSREKRTWKSFSPDGVARLWGLPIDEVVQLAKTRLTRGLTAEERARYVHAGEGRDTGEGRGTG